MKFSCIVAILVVFFFLYFIFKLFSYISKSLLNTDKPTFVYVDPRSKK